ncbi:hypothetical protein PNU63_16880, partial [[Ruminococcus] gnavus]
KTPFFFRITQGVENKNNFSGLSGLGKRNECIALFKQLEEVATEKDKEYIQNSIKFVQEQLEK